MSEESGKERRRRGIAAACGVLALAAVLGAYWMGRSAGSGGDIGEEAAKSAALSHAEVVERDLSSYEIARDENGGSPVYEVRFTAGGAAYDYEVSAVTGSIVKFSRETEGTALPPDAGAPVPEGGDIGEARAWEIAYGHAGVAAEDAAVSPVKLDYDNGVLVYELEFFSGGYEYDYEISAADGSVVKFEKEADTVSSPAQTPAGDAASAPDRTPAVPASAGDIGEARAREIALAHAGVATDSAAGYQWKQDYDDGVLVYELEFFSGGYEYDYEINAADGSIVKFEKEADGTTAAAQGSQGTSAAAPAYIGEARAREIAFAHAGLAADTVTHCTVELDHHDDHHGSRHGPGCCEYEIDFWSGGYEYECKMNAVTGEIMEFEQDS